LKKGKIIIGAAVVCAFLGACHNNASYPANVWAVVNGKQITSDEVDKSYRSRVNAQSPTPPSQEEALSLKLGILDELINSEILLERAQKQNLGATDAEVEEKFTEAKSPYTEEEFQSRLKASGLTVDDLKTDLRKQLSIQKLLNRDVVAKISITDQDVTDYYNKNRAQFNVTEPQYHILQIVITPRPDPNVHNRRNDKAANEADAGRKAASIMQKISAGADFGQLAMDYSEDSSSSTGGDLGFVPESSLNQSDPVLKKAILGMKPGAVSQPIPVQGGGYRILKLAAKETAGQRELTDPDVQQSVRDMLHNRKEQLLRSSYLAEARDEARVNNLLAAQILESAGKLPAAN